MECRRFSIRGFRRSERSFERGADFLGDLNSGTGFPVLPGGLSEYRNSNVLIYGNTARWKLRTSADFLPNCAVWKMRNTSSIPALSIPSIGPKPLAESPCSIMRCCPYSNVRWLCSNAARMFTARNGAMTMAMTALKVVAGSLAMMVVRAAAGVRPFSSRPL